MWNIFGMYAGHFGYAPPRNITCTGTAAAGVNTNTNTNAGTQQQPRKQQQQQKKNVPKYDWIWMGGPAMA
jgi:hypothetical protein